jgi:enamine deaminase RidA (YjgF/YER057c/UK114 family)
MSDLGGATANTVQRTDVNPWTWQQPLGFTQGIAVAGAQRLVVLAGQGPVDANGQLIGAGDIATQINVALDNVQSVLAEAGLTLADVVRLTIFTTDVDRSFESYDTFTERLGTAGCRPTSSLVGVTRLALPGMRVEFEATAVA